MGLPQRGAAREHPSRIEVLSFGKNSFALATLVAELRGRKYGKQALLLDAGFKALSAKKCNGICPVTKTKKCTPACRHGSTTGGYTKPQWLWRRWR